MPKVTVGIPFFNAHKYLKYAIRSVISQTYADWELILVDDGSTDNSLGIARHFKDDRIRIIHDPVNRGISFRLNQIISEAGGKYIARMDADDICFPERLEVQIKLLEADPQLDMADSSAVIINEENKITGFRSMLLNTSDKRKVYDAAPFLHPTLLFRKDFIEKYRYDSQYDGAEDRDLWIRCHETARIGKIDHPLYFYREDEKLNLKSYLFRNAQLLKLLNKNKEKLPLPVYLYLRAKNLARRLTASVAVVLKQDSRLIKRRNRRVTPEDMSRYSEKLEAVLRHG